VRLWIRKADEDLALIEHLLGEDTPYLSAVAFHSQQAAEKYLKAFLVHRQCEFSKTHDLDRLLALVATVNKPLAAKLVPLSELTPYAVEARYPSDYPEVTNAELSVRTISLDRWVKPLRRRSAGCKHGPMRGVQDREGPLCGLRDATAHSGFAQIRVIRRRLLFELKEGTLPAKRRE